MSKDDEATDVADAEPINWPDTDDVSVTDPPIEDEPAKADPPPEDKAKDDDKDDKWDADRQKVDETAATARKNADAISSIKSTVDNLPDQLRDMLAQMVADKGEGQAPPAETADDLMAQIAELTSNEDADFDDLRKALGGLAKKVQAGLGSKAGADKSVEKALKELREKDAARDTREAGRNAQNRVSDYLADLERIHFNGKRTHRTDIINGAKEVCAKMGFNDTTNPPPESTGLLALEKVTAALASKQQAAKEAKDSQVVTDSMSAGRPADFGDKHQTMDEAVKELGL